MRRTFDTPGHVELDVRLPAGRIDLDTGESAKTEVELLGRDDAELAQVARIEMREREGAYEVLVDVADDRGWGFKLLSRDDYRLRVLVPKGADARLATASGDVRARGAYGVVRIESGSGDVAVEEAAGSLSVKSGSGDVSVDAVGGDADVSTASGDVEVSRVAGTARIRTASGDVHVREAQRDLAVNTASGDQVVESVASGNVTLQSAAGDIEVGVRSGSAVWVDARSMTGDTSSELDLDDVPDETGETGPVVELRATTMSGDIRLVRA